MQRTFVVALSLSLCALVSPFAAVADPMDWTNWRGPEQNGISRETGLVDKWNTTGENLFWVKPELATRSTPILMNGKLYTLARSEPGTIREGEKVICADANTGEVLWESKFNVFLSDVPDTRVAWSCVVGDPQTNRVYALGVCGLFLCLDGDTGKTIWSHSLSEEYGLLTTYGGRTNIPVLFEDMVIISGVLIGWGEQARPRHRFLAFNKDNGQLIWSNGTRPLPDDTTYSTPVIGMLGDQLAMVFGSGDGGVHAFQPRTGQPIWNYQLSLRGINTTPLLDGDTVYIGQSEENVDDNTMGNVTAIDGTGKGDITKTGTLWSVKELMVGKTAPLLVDGRLYVATDNGGLHVLDAKTGKEIHKQKLGTMMRASPVYADGKIFTCESNGRWYILEPSESGFKVLHRLRVKGEVHGTPVVSHGRIYLPTTDMMYCIGKADQKPAITSSPKPRSESPTAEDSKPAQLQLVPAEMLIRPGETVQYQVRTYNSRGQLLEQKNQKVQYTVDGEAKIDAGGKLTTSPSASHHALTVTAQAGDLQAQALVRVVPDLPWEFDFANNEVPITWVGARYRHVPRTVDGEPMIVKITTIPKGTRSQSWMGHPDFHDYTIQADVKAADARLPDIGLIAQRYTLDMMGTHQQLQIRTWPSVLRMAKTIPFEWKHDVWYRIIFCAENQEGKVVLRGKVWPREEPEPAEWTIVAEDPAPNTTGSPGLFGNATNSEIFIDNVKVMPNP